MILAAQLWGSPDAFVYKALFVLHIVAVVGAFGPALAQPALMRIVKTGSDGAATAAKVSADISRRYTLPGIIVAALAGILLSAGSGGAYSFDQPWISASFAIVLFVLLVVWFLVIPAHALLSGDGHGGQRAKAAARLSMATGLVHLGFLVLVILMIWKPS